jgi:hypothetical protein
MVAAYMQALKSTQVGFDEACFDWYGGEAGLDKAKSHARGSIYQSRDFAKAYDLLSQAPADADAKPDHRYFQNDNPMHLRVDQVEAIWAPIAATDDWSSLRSALAQIHDMSDAYGWRQNAPAGMLLSSPIRP